MDRINRHTGNLMTCIFEILTGILLLVNPVGFTSGIIILCGIVLAVMGVGSLIQYFRTDAETAAQKNSLAKGIICVLSGLFCIFRSNWFIITFPLLTVIYGILNLLCGISKVQWAVDMLRAKKKYWFIEGIGAVLTIICAILILGNPFASAAVLWTFIGVTLIAEAVVDGIAFVWSRK